MYVNSLPANLSRDGLVLIGTPAISGASALPS